MDIASKKGMRLFEGVYVMSGGPQYESPAEVRQRFTQKNSMKDVSNFKH